MFILSLVFKENVIIELVMVGFGLIKLLILELICFGLRGIKYKFNF